MKPTKVEELQNWQVPVRCGKCDDVIWSKFAGQYAICKCGAIAVDQTPYYCRNIGDPKDFKPKDKPVTPVYSQPKVLNPTAPDADDWMNYGYGF